MTQTSFPFDSGPGSTVLEAQWSKMAREWRSTGVLPGVLNECAVTAPGSGLTVQIAPGRAWIEGHLWESDATESLVLTAAHPSLPRIDRVILRLDWSNNTISLGVLTGTPASTPVAPALTQTTALWEISLAQVSVPAGATTITNANITDERPWSTGRGATRLATVTAAATLPLAAVAYNSSRLLVVPVTGSTTISNIPVLPAGTYLLLEFQTTGQITNSSTVLLAAQGTQTLNADSTILFVSTGTAWREVARSISPVGPVIRVGRTTAQGIPNMTYTNIVWDSEIEDSNGWFSPGSASITVQYAGWYHIMLFVRWQIASTGVRLIRLILNGALELAGISGLPPGSVETYQTITWHGRLAANDVVVANCLQTSGVTLNVDAVSRLTLARLGV